MATVEYKHALLSRHVLFRSLAAEEITSILKLAKERRFADGQTIFQKGEAGPSLMAVLDGRVRISSCSPEGKEVILSIVEPGQIFGEIALLDGQARSADATAAGDCTVLVIDRPEFNAFLERNPQITARLLSFLCQRLRGADEMIEEMAFLEVPGRLARLLLRLARSYGHRTDGGHRIGLKLAQQDLGNLIAASRESVNKTLRAWQDAGVIDMQQGYITLLRPDDLEGLAGERELEDVAGAR
jgi:CRP/FNR family cyclic AMP-dependent transcriptional regulator